MFIAQVLRRQCRPEPFIDRTDKIFTAAFSTLSAIRRFDGRPRDPWTTALSPTFFNPLQQPLHLPNAQSQFLGRGTLRDYLPLNLLQCH